MAEVPSSEDRKRLFRSEVKSKGKEFELNLSIEEESIEISLFENCPKKFIQKSYRAAYTYKSLLNFHNFFRQFENINEIFEGIKDFIVINSYKLQESENKIFLIIKSVVSDVKLAIPEMPKKDEDVLTHISKSLFELKSKLLEKIQEIEEINRTFSEIKKQNEKLIEDNKKFCDTNERLIHENRKLKDTIKLLKETKIELIDDKLGALLRNSLKTNEEKVNEKLLREAEGKIRGDLLNENTIAFDIHCKAYLWHWLNYDKKDRKIHTILLYKGTRDWGNATTFHQKCDGRGPTLTLVKSSTNFHFGGFTPTDWSDSGKEGYKDSPRSFLFSLDRKLKYLPKIASQHIYTGSQYGPIFGAGHDLYIVGEFMSSESISNPKTYSITDSFSGGSQFRISEIEVYQVIFL